MTDSDRMAKGQEILRQLRGGGDAPVAGGATAEVFPDLWKMIQEHVFGELWARPGLGLRDRCLITITVLTALARTEELRMHMHNALNMGISEQEVLEMAMHVAHYAGWPTGVNACRVAKDVFAARKKRAEKSTN